MPITANTDDDKKQTVEIALKAAQAMIKAGINAVGKAKVNDYDWNNRALSLAVGFLLISFQKIDEAIPRLAAEAYLKNLEKKKPH